MGTIIKDLIEDTFVKKNTNIYELSILMGVDSFDFMVMDSRQHLLAIGSVLLVSALSGALLQRYSSAALPYLDSFTTWGSILTTWMVARKILENWLYWLVIDSVSIYLYLDRAQCLTALLFVLYLVIVVFGYFQWLRHYRTQSS